MSIRLTQSSMRCIIPADQFQIIVKLSVAALRGGLTFGFPPGSNVFTEWPN
jgi:hypothetical protein